MLNLKVNMQDLLRQVREFAKKYESDLWPILRDQMRLYSQDLQRHTPSLRPGGALPKGFRKLSRMEDKDPAKRIPKILFVSIDSMATLQWMKKRWGKAMPENTFWDTATLPDLISYLKAHRSKTGRIRQDRKVKTFGNFDIAVKPHVTKRTVNLLSSWLRNERDKHKAGWSATILRYGGKNQLSGIEKHGTKYGTSTERGFGFRIWIKAINRAPYAKRFERLWVGLHNKRVKDLQKWAIKRYRQRIREQKKRSKA